MLKVMAVVDLGTGDTSALDRATILAAAAGARLTVVGLGGTRNKPAEDHLATLAKTCEGRGIEVESTLVSGKPAASILRVAAEQVPDLLVVPTELDAAGTGSAKSAWYDDVLRKAACPTLVARGEVRRQYRNVVVASDLSPSLSNCAQVLRNLGITTSTKSSVVHAFPVPGLRLAMGHTLQDEGRKKYLEAERHEAAVKLKALMTSAALGDARVTLAPAKGKATEIIMEAAKAQDADLIVVGTHNRRRVARAFLGSVAQSVVHAAPCDVLTVPPNAGGTD